MHFHDITRNGFVDYIKKNKYINNYNERIKAEKIWDSGGIVGILGQILRKRDSKIC